jgi:predicted nucleic acid-binding protein
MGESVLADAGFIVALLNRDDRHHPWATALAARYARPWRTCEAVLSEAFFVLPASGIASLSELLRRRSLLIAFELDAHLDAVLRLMHKYGNVPMSLADGCLVRMSETVDSPIVLTTDSDFRIYRRHGRNVVPCVLPP